MNKTVALVSEREEDFVFAAEVAKQCQADLMLFSSLDKVVEFAAHDSGCQAIFLGLTNVDEAKAVGSIGEGKIYRHQVHAILSPADNEVAVAAFRSGMVGSCVINRFSNPLHDGQHYSRVVKAVNQDRCFGLGSLIQATSGIQTIRLTDSLQKGFAANAVAFHLRELKCNERISRTVAGAVDELLMNAMFDAPVTDTGVRKHDNTPRSTKIEVTGVEMQIGLEDELIGITVRDSVGSLNLDTVFNHVSKSFESSQINSLRGAEYEGAGIGLSMVVRSGGSMFFVTEPGKRTEVTVFFRQTEKFRDFKNPFQFIASRVYR